MINVLFLNEVQKDILEEQGVNLNTLTCEKLREHLNYRDYSDIIDNTNVVLSKDGLLCKLGATSKDFNISDYYDSSEGLSDLPPGTIINAIGGNDETIVLWIEKSHYNNTHDMYKHSRINILKALTKFKIFSQLKMSTIFESAILAGGM